MMAVGRLRVGIDSSTFRCAERTTYGSCILSNITSLGGVMSSYLDYPIVTLLVKHDANTTYKISAISSAFSVYREHAFYA
jgi:hypothetical protein